MGKIYISESDPDWKETWEKWKDNAKSISTIDEFDEFYDHLMNDYHHDYGTVCRAIGELAVAAASLGANQQGITGFQAGFIMFEFMYAWKFRNNKTGLKILNYDDMLFPQYQHKYEKTITLQVWESLQREAKKNLDNDLARTSPNVIKHWQSIVDGKVPFGYTVEEW